MEGSSCCSTAKGQLWGQQQAQQQPLSSCGQREHYCTMEATLEDTMVDTIHTTVMFSLAARGERLLLSLLLTPKLTLGCTTTATILLTTMEGTTEDTTPMCMENKIMPYYATTDEMTPTVSNFQKICLSASA